VREIPVTNCGDEGESCCNETTCTTGLACLENVNSCQDPLYLLTTDQNNCTYPAPYGGKASAIGAGKCSQLGSDDNYWECEFVQSTNTLQWDYKYDCLYDCQDQYECSVEDGYCEQTGCCLNSSISSKVYTNTDNYRYYSCYKDATKSEPTSDYCTYFEDGCEWDTPCVTVPQPCAGFSCEAQGYRDYYCESGRKCCYGECWPTSSECVDTFDCDSAAWGWPGRYEYQDNCGNLMCLTTPCAGVCTPPGAPTLDPEDGERVQLGVGEQVELSWSVPANADTFEMWLYPTGTSCSDANAVCQDMGASTTYSFDPVDDSYFYQVRGYNADCPTIPGTWATATFDIRSRIEGTVREGDWVMVGGVCTGVGGGVKPGGGSRVGAVGDPPGGAVNGHGGYRLNNIPIGGGDVVVLDIGDPDIWICTCPNASCAYGGISAPVEDLDFFVSDDRPAWFQVDSGNLHANSGDVSSLIPLTAIEPYLNTGVAGVASYTGSLGLGDLDEESINETGESWRATTSYGGIQTDYGYFSRLMQDDPDGVGSWGGGGAPGSGVYQASGGVVGEGGWSIGSGSKIVLFFDGDVTVEGDISVDVGGFLAVIASGNISVADTVVNVEGVYIADGIFSSGAGGNQLIGEGMFVGWIGISLGRNLADDLDNTLPAEKFYWRPDLQLNAYQYMLKPYYSWKEVAP